MADSTHDGKGNNDGSTDNPDTQVGPEDEQDVTSGGAPERPDR